MPIVRLPDGSEKNFDQPVTVNQVAESIGAGLAKAAIAGKVDGVLVDTSYEIHTNTDVAIVTGRDEEGLDIIRHSTAHLLAHAVKELYPEAQVTIGPVIENGFFYDFAYEPGFSEDDLPAIEARMKEIAKKDYQVVREEIERDDAIKFFRDLGEEYKAKIIEDIPAGETLTIYRQGDFVDLCRGPHTPRTGMLKAFKLTKVSGAYWRGDPKNEMLQRIYGTAWPDKKALKDYLHRLEEAEKRDHRKLAKKMDLFHTQEEAPGMVFWHPNGWALYLAVEKYIREVTRKTGYQEINTPMIADLSLWEKSGHMSKFSDEMFLTESENRGYAIKPMSCPCHVQVFNQGLKSYRDLPLRYSEFGVCHRNEPSGTLHGLMRVRKMTQDDGHIFCTEDQIQPEVSAFIDQLYQVYRDFGFEDVTVKLATRPDNRVGEDETWDKAEQALETSLNNSDLAWELSPGEGAFYGPKLEFSLRDCIGRVWQCGTMQVDFSMPGRLGATYIAEDGSKQVPVMLHRALLGTLDRFIGVLIEHYAGNLPLWLAPVQIVLMNITDNQADFVQQVTHQLQEKGFRAQADLRNEKVGYKIRENTIKRVPYLAVIGDRELEQRQVSLRTQSGVDIGTLGLQELFDRLNSEVASLGKMEE